MISTSLSGCFTVSAPFLLTMNETSSKSSLSSDRAFLFSTFRPSYEDLSITGSVTASLVKSGLIGIDDETYELHSVLRDLFRQSLSREKLEELNRLCATICTNNAKDVQKDAPGNNAASSLLWLEAFHHALNCSDYGLMLSSLAHCSEFLEKNGMIHELLSAIEICSSLGLDLPVEAYLSEARLLRLLGNLDDALSRIRQISSDDLSHRNLAMVSYLTGMIHQDKNEYDVALSSYYKALESARAADDTASEGKILGAIATIARERSEYKRARNFYLQAIKASKAAKEYDDVYFSIHNLARICYFQGDYEKALELYTDVLFGREYTPGELTAALAKNGMGEVLRCQGKISKARELFSANEAFYRQSGNRFGLAFTLRNMGSLDVIMGYFDRARNNFVESLRLSKTISNVYGQADCHKSLGSLATMLGDIPQAKNCFAKARELFESIGSRRGLAHVHFDEATMEMASSSLNKAMDHLEESLKIREAIGDSAGLAWVLFEKGNLSLHRGEYYVADRLYNRGLREMKKITDKNGEAACLAGLGKVACGTGHYDRALQLFEEARDLLISIGDVTGRSFVLIEMGHLFRLKGDYGTAMAAYEEALSLSSSSSMSLIEAEAFDGISLIKSDLGKIGEAEELLRRSLIVRQRMEGTLSHAASLSNLASLEARLGNFAQEKTLLDQSFRILRSLDNKREIQKTLGCLATIERNRGNYDEAERLINEAYRYGREISDRRGMAIALQQSAQLKLLRNEITEAGLLFEASLAIKRQIDDTRGIASTLISMGEMYLSIDLIDRAEELFLEAGRGAEEHGYSSVLVEARLGIGEVEVRKGNFKGASRIADEISTILEESGPSAGQSAGLSRLWALLAVEEGQKDDAVYLMNFARDLYSELGQTHNSQKLENELKALSKDTLLETLDRRINIIEELESLEIIDAHDEASEDGYRFCAVVAFELKDLSKCSLVFPSRVSNKDLIWQGERAGLFLQFFTHSKAAVKSLTEMDLSRVNKIVAHGGMAKIRSGIAGGAVATLPFRLISQLPDGDCLMSGAFIGGTTLLESEAVKANGEIKIREQLEPLALYTIHISKIEESFM